MSDLLTGVDINFLHIIWAISGFFTVSAVLICVGLSIRRLKRNRRQRIREDQKQNFESYIVRIIKTPGIREQDMPSCSKGAMTFVLLHYLRTLRGQGFERLQDFTSRSGLETQITEAAGEGIRGRRMRALTVLSYLKSEASLEVLFQNLGSVDKYVRITAARGLVRRKAVPFLDEITTSLHEAFPNEPNLIAAILSRFGPEAAEPLEALISQSNEDMIKVICLETLVIIMPPETGLDLGGLMNSSDVSIRAATLSLSAVSEHNSAVDPLMLGLKDVKTKVKIRAAKLLTKVKRADLVSDLYGLNEDPVFWVRYWALKAIWKSGQSGQRFVTSLGKTNSMAENVTLEMKSGYV